MLSSPSRLPPLPSHGPFDTFEFSLPVSKRQVAERVDDAISLRLVVPVERPVREPLPRHHVLDGKLAPRDALLAEARLSVSPAAPVILDRLEHHPKPAATETAIGEQARKLLADLRIVRPVPAAAGLAGEVLLDHIAGSRAIRLPQQRDELGDDLVVVLRRRAHEHAAHHPALHDVQRLDELRLRNRRLLGIEQAEHERLDDFALEHAGAIAEQPEPVDRPGVRRRAGDELAVDAATRREPARSASSSAARHRDRQTA